MKAYRINPEKFDAYFKNTRKRWYLTLLVKFSLYMGAFAVLYTLSNHDYFYLFLLILLIIYGIYKYVMVVSYIGKLALYKDVAYVLDDTSLKIVGTINTSILIENITAMQYSKYGVRVCAPGSVHYRVVKYGGSVVPNKDIIFIPDVLDGYMELTEYLRLNTPNAKKYEN